MRIWEVSCLRHESHRGLGGMVMVAEQSGRLVRASAAPWFVWKFGLLVVLGCLMRVQSSRSVLIRGDYAL